MAATENDDLQEDARRNRERWQHLPARILPEQWNETVAVTTPEELPVVLGDGVAYRGGVPISN